MVIAGLLLFQSGSPRYLKIDNSVFHKLMAVLETPRLILRPFLDKMQSRDRAGEPSQFAVIVQTTGQLIGFCGFFGQNVDGVERIEIGYRFHPDYWGQGIATEAARAVRDYAFQMLELNQIISLVHPDNISSRRVAEKNGMMVEKETIFRGFPAVVYAMDRAAFDALKTQGAAG